MGTKGDFYVDTDWIGSTSWDAYPEGIPDKIKKASGEEEYKTSVQSWLASRKESYLPKKGWPWPWYSSYKTNYSYSFRHGKVWACAFGSSWWIASEPEPDHTTLQRRGAVLPDMSHLPRAKEGFILPKKRKKKK